MSNFRSTPPTTLANIAITKIEDYLDGNVNGLPRADVLKFYLADDSWFCLRPSGTEPKFKIYIGVKTGSMENSEQHIQALKADIQQYIINERN